MNNSITPTHQNKFSSLQLVNTSFNRYDDDEPDLCSADFSSSVVVPLQSDTTSRDASIRIKFITPSSINATHNPTCIAISPSHSLLPTHHISTTSLPAVEIVNQQRNISVQSDDEEFELEFELDDDTTFPPLVALNLSQSISNASVNTQNTLAKQQKCISSIDSARILQNRPDVRLCRIPLLSKKTLLSKSIPAHLCIQNQNNLVAPNTSNINLDRATNPSEITHSFHNTINIDPSNHGNNTDSGSGNNLHQSIDQTMQRTFLIKSLLRQHRLQSASLRNESKNDQIGSTLAQDQALRDSLTSIPLSIPSKHTHAEEKAEKLRILADRRLFERKQGLLDWRILINTIRQEICVIEDLVYAHHIKPDIINVNSTDLMITRDYPKDTTQEDNNSPKQPLKDLFDKANAMDKNVADDSDPLLMPTSINPPTFSHNETTNKLNTDVIHQQAIKRKRGIDIVELDNSQSMSQNIDEFSPNLLKESRIQNTITTSVLPTSTSLSHQQSTPLQLPSSKYSPTLDLATFVQNRLQKDQNGNNVYLDDDETLSVKKQRINSTFVKQHQLRHYPGGVVQIYNPPNSYDEEDDALI